MAKPALKAAKEALVVKNYELAIEQSKKALSFDANNYNANVFLGVAYFSTKQLSESKEAYLDAIKIDEKAVLAWQGLWNLYESTHDISELHKITPILASKFLELEEQNKCLNTVNKYMEVVKKYGNKADEFKALKLLTPEEGEIYEYLEGRVLPLQTVYMQMVDIQESMDRSYFESEVNKRKTRLGARLEQVMRDVELEIYKDSPLETLYNQIINYAETDEIRRLTESKLLHMYNKLLILSEIKEKSHWRERIWDLIQGMVTLHIPEQAAWTIYFEWQDHSDISFFQSAELQEYIELFPGSPLAQALFAFRNSDLWHKEHPIQLEDSNNSAELAKETKEEDDSENSVDKKENEEDITSSTMMPQDEVLANLTEAYENAPQSTIISECLAKYYIHLKEYEYAIGLSKAALEVLKRLQQDTGVKLDKLTRIFQLCLAIGYSHYEVPRYLFQAMHYYDILLAADPRNYHALLGKGLVQIENEQYSDAVKTLGLLLDDHENDPSLSELSWCYFKTDNLPKAISTVEKCLDVLLSMDVERFKIAEAYYRYGIYILNRKSENYLEDSFSAFVSSLRKDPNYAPAYTSLGLYYRGIHDMVRATKCFQKAFELDASQVEAAEALAKTFAEANEWELVEVISRRVLNTSENDLKRKKKFNWHHTSLGVLELNAKNFHKAIVHFQSALRISPKDTNAWSGLGEAYARSGRYVSALKAFNRASILDPDDWYVKYFIATLEKDMGEYEVAVSTLSEISAVRSKELCVQVSLAETYVRLAKLYHARGFYSRAADSLEKSIQICCNVLKEDITSIFSWEILGDACLSFCQLKNYHNRFPNSLISDILFTTEAMKCANNGRQFENMIYLPDLETSSGAIFIAAAAITCFTIHLSLVADDKLLLPVSWYNLGSSYYRFYECDTTKDATLQVAINCIKQAIKLEAKNYVFWNMLGVLFSQTKAVRSAQHCYIQSLLLNERSSGVWANYGALCIQNHDVECANAAFTRSISIDPDNSQAWLGKAYCSIAVGSIRKAVQIIHHAFEISSGKMPDVNYWYADTMLHAVNTEDFVTTDGDIWSATYAIKRYLGENPTDTFAYYIKASLLEHLGETTDSVPSAIRLCELLEQEYDVSESPVILKRFIDAKALLGRLYLAKKSFENSVEQAGIALDLLEGEEDEDIKRTTLGLNLTCGTASFFLNKLEKSLDCFEKALLVSDSNADVVVLVSKVLWALGSENGKQAAREQLFEALEQSPSHIGSLLCLGAIAIYDEDDAVCSAIEDSIAHLKKDEVLRSGALKQVQIMEVLLTKKIDESMIKSLLQRFLHVYPFEASSWTLLTNRYSSKSLANAFATTLYTHPSRPDDLAQSYRLQNSIDRAQVAIHLVPWDSANWKALHGVTHEALVSSDAS